MDYMGNDKIRALSDREKARDKLPIFYGSRDNYLHGFKEVLNNAVDEVLNNFDTGIIDIILHKDLETITVKDSGRGIPIADVNENNIPYYELIFTTLFAGGKYDDTNLNATGTNGVGTCILNYSSDYFKAISCNNGKKYIIEYENGGYIKTPLTYIEDTTEHGTQITFKLDNSIYTKTKYNYQEIRDIIDKTAKVSNKITLTLTYETKEAFHYMNLHQYFNYHTKNNIIEPLIGQNKIYEEIDGEKTQIELVLSCSNEENLLQECMLNGNNLIEKSSIFEGVINGIRLFVHKYIKDNNLYIKKEKSISNDDIENCVNFCCNVLSNRVEFQSQTKFSTAKKLYKTVVQQYIQELLEIYSIEQKDDFVRLVNQILICKRAYEKAEKSKNDIKKKLSEKVDSINGRVDGLVDCKYHNEESELFITEGKSALGGILLSRNGDTQAGYAIRGKILSCLKASLEKIFGNAVVTDLIKIIGCGVEVKSKHNKDLNTYNIDNIRYQRIIICTDQDFDGLAIQALLLTMIYRLMKDLIVKGRVYIAQTPKFVITNNETKYYAFTDDEKDTIIKKLQGKTHVNYLKGIGELNSIDMYNTALNPDTRQMIKVTIEDVEKMIKNFDVWMSDDVTDRKKYITEHLHEYINDEE
jgi:DNA gyrase subunit B